MKPPHYNADYRRRNDNAISNEHAGVVKVPGGRQGSGETAHGAARENYRGR